MNKIRIQSKRTLVLALAIVLTALCARTGFTSNENCPQSPEYKL
jgi:hypothetical protein